MTETMDLETFLEQYGEEWQASNDDEHMELEAYMAKYGGKLKAKMAQKMGAEGEDVAAAALRACGIRMVEQIATPFAITAKREGGWVRIKRKAKVSGDRRGVMGDGSGRRVLAEVKSTGSDRIKWSRLRDNQVRALDENNRLGAVSLLVVVFNSVAFVLRWPVDGFGPGTSIRVEHVTEHVWDGVS